MKICKILIVFILVMSMVLSMTACGEKEPKPTTPTQTTEPDPSPTDTTEPETTPTPTITETDKPVKLVWPDVVSSNIWDKDSSITSGSYVYELSSADDGLTLSAPNFTGTMKIKGAITDGSILTIDMPKATVEFEGKADTLNATTGMNSLHVKKGAEIGTLNVKGGNVVIEENITLVEVEANSNTKTVVAKKEAVVAVKNSSSSAVVAVVNDTATVTIIATTTPTYVENNSTTNIETKKNDLDTETDTNAKVEPNKSAIIVLGDTDVEKEEVEIPETDDKTVEFDGTKDVTVPFGFTMTIAGTQTLNADITITNYGTIVIANDATFTNEGTIVNNGEITNDGIINVDNEESLSSAVLIGGNINLTNDILLTKILHICVSAIISGANGTDGLPIFDLYGDAINNDTDKITSGKAGIEIVLGDNEKVVLKDLNIHGMDDVFAVSAYGGTQSSTTEFENLYFTDLYRTALGVSSGSYKINNCHFDAKDYRGPLANTVQVSGTGVDYLVSGEMSDSSITNSTQGLTEWASTSVLICANSFMDLKNCDISNAKYAIMCDSYLSEETDINANFVIDNNTTFTNIYCTKSYLNYNDLSENIWIVSKYDNISYRASESVGFYSYKDSVYEFHYFQVKTWNDKKGKSFDEIISNPDFNPKTDVIIALSNEDSAFTGRVYAYNQSAFDEFKQTPEFKKGVISENSFNLLFNGDIDISNYFEQDLNAMISGTHNSASAELTKYHYVWDENSSTLKWKEYDSGGWVFIDTNYSTTNDGEGNPMIITTDEFFCKIDIENVSFVKSNTLLVGNSIYKENLQISIGMNYWLYTEPFKVIDGDLYIARIVLESECGQDGTIEVSDGKNKFTLKLYDQNLKDISSIYSAIDSRCNQPVVVEGNTITTTIPKGVANPYPYLKIKFSDDQDNEMLNKNSISKTNEVQFGITKGSSEFSYDFEWWGVTEPASTTKTIKYIGYNPYAIKLVLKEPEVD